MPWWTALSNRIIPWLHICISLNELGTCGYFNFRTFLSLSLPKRDTSVCDSDLETHKLRFRQWLLYFLKNAPLQIAAVKIRTPQWWHNLSCLNLPALNELRRLQKGEKSLGGSHWEIIRVNAQFHNPIKILWNWSLKCQNFNSRIGISARTPTPIPRHLVGSITFEFIPLSIHLVQPCNPWNPSPNCKRLHIQKSLSPISSNIRTLYNDPYAKKSIRINLMRSRFIYRRKGRHNMHVVVKILY